ncbi:MAG: glyoxalase [Ilumatobacter sp.]|uniref:glyoxalase n=1 Tax=Ilumatobacter sp. TaxID=1967498 RepID=UPI002636B703|nr:glyoxalase [Ilumatobacter sp.]MDJ0768071.1 glyoxalase [Ilumatobacter sp.]
METAKSGASDRSRWAGIDHVQLAIPVGGEPSAREFFVDRLGFSEVPKPPALARRGGAWFSAGGIQVHVGVEEDFVPARKAHPALLVRGLRRLIESTGLDAAWSDEIPGVERCHVADPFGNRIELIEAGEQ